MTAAVSREWDVSSEEGRTSLATLQLYQTSLKGISPGFVPLASLELQELYLAAALVEDGDGQGWSRMAANPTRSPLETWAPLQSASMEALEVFSQSIALLGADQEAPMDPYAFDVLQMSLVRPPSLSLREVQL